MAAPHGTKRRREDDEPNEGRRPTKIAVGDTENYPVLWSDITQLPRLCWSLRDVDRHRGSNSAPAVRNITRSHSVASPAPEVRYLRDLDPGIHTHTGARPGPRRSRLQDEHYSLAQRPIRPAVYGLIQEQHLLDHRILLPSTSPQVVPTDLEKCLRSLETLISSLTTTSFPPQTFHDFLRRHDHPPADDRLLPDGVLDTIAGRAPAFPSNNIYVAFNAMKPVNDITDITPVPYAFDGVRPSDLEHKIRDKAEDILLTTKRYELPVAPNFFFEAGRQDGIRGGSTRAAAVDGAYGARGMWVLRNCGRKGQKGCIGEGLAFSATYDDEISSTTGRAIKVLRLYAHHVTADSDSDEDVEVDGLTYHMTALGSWEMTGDYDEFLKGATAFRNLRLWAAMVRVGAVDEVNYMVSLEKR